MIKKLIDPELLADLEINLDFDMWADLPTTRLGFKAMMAAGVAAELHVFPGGTHAFEFKVPSTKISRRAHYLNFDILKNALSIDEV